jgi:hypothetical protein
MGGVALSTLILVGVPVVAYGLHRFFFLLEKRGWLYYRDKKPSSSPASCFVALQQFLEPPTCHVHQVRENQRGPTERAPAGPDEPPVQAEPGDESNPAPAEGAAQP